MWRAVWLWIRVEALVAWSCFRHPFVRTVIYQDRKTGRVWAEHGEVKK